MTPSPKGALRTDLRRTAWRIGLQTAVLLMACLVVVGAVVFLAVVRSQDDQLTQTLTDAVATAGSGGGMDRDHDHDLSEPRGGVQFAVLDGRGLQTSTGLPPGMPDLTVMRGVASTGVSDRRTVHLATGAYEVLTSVRGDDVVQVLASTFEQHQERERILGALALAGGAGLLLSTLAAATLARRAVRPMAQALELQRRFVADAGHELRTPLTLLSTRAQLLSRRLRAPTGTPSLGSAPDPLIGRDADGIVADTTALTAILEELLLAADVRTPVPQEPVDLDTVVTAAVASAHATAEDHGVTLALRPAHGSTVISRGAPTALSRSVTALLDNALGHARAHVDVSVRRQGRSVVIEVTDDGPGVPTDALPRLFDRFASGRPEPLDAGGRRHFGLGLALVSEIATRHGGTVTATNRPPPAHGAVLRLVLPV